MQNFKIDRIPLDKNGNPIAESGIEKKTPDGIQKTDNTFKVSRLPDGYAAQAFKVKRIQLPDAQFSADHTGGCAPHTVQFSGSDSAYADSFQYDFGDYQTAGDQNISHEYTAGGLYTVALTAHSVLALADDTLTRYQYVEVLTPPIADFSGTPTSGDVILPVSFSPNCTGDVSDYIWAFGDGQTSGLQNPAHSYTAAGTYGVALTAGNKYCSDYLVKDNYISVSQSGPVWVSKFDNTFWEPNTDYGCGPDTVWSGSNWNCTGGGGGEVVCLRDIGSWVNGYRPRKIRVTSTGGATNVFFMDSAMSILAEGSVNAELDITFGSNDIHAIEIFWGGDTQVTNIEFYEEG